MSQSVRENPFFWLTKKLHSSLILKPNSYVIMTIGLLLLIAGYGIRDLLHSNLHLFLMDNNQYNIDGLNKGLKVGQTILIIGWIVFTISVVLVAIYSYYFKKNMNNEIGSNVSPTQMPNLTPNTTTASNVTMHHSIQLNTPN